MIDIRAGSVFINKDGRTVKIEDVNHINKVTYTVDGGFGSKSDRLESVKKMLESGGYQDITQTFSGFFIAKKPTYPAIGTIKAAPFPNDNYIAE
jgi:hypothetical protein